MLSDQIVCLCPRLNPMLNLYNQLALEWSYNKMFGLYDVMEYLYSLPQAPGTCKPVVLKFLGTYKC